MTFETRKSFFLHRRKLHTSTPKIKNESSSTSTTSETEVKGEPFKTNIEAGDLIPKTEQVNIFHSFSSCYSIKLPKNIFNCHNMIFDYLVCRRVTKFKWRIYLRPMRPSI